MEKVRVYELAKKLEIGSKVLIEKLQKLGVEVKSHMSSLDGETVELVLDSLKVEGKEKAAEKKEEQISVNENLTVGQLAGKIGIKPNEIIKKLMQRNIFASLNEKLNKSAMGVASKEFGFEVGSHVPAKEKIPKKKEEEGEEEEAGNLLPRSAIVTIMGHVNHGKTSLLDSIRNTNVVRGEKGGITQHIGADKVKVKNGEVVFLDTPGHEAFTSMRARGANVTDIVILVVAADDGVMPQTIEAIDHAHAADVPIVVAINKIDKPGTDPEQIKRELQEHGVIVEEFGGKTICVNISATQKKGLDELMEILLLEAEMLELKANPDGFAKGTIIEAKLDVRRGPVATVLVQKGELKIGDYFVAGVFEGKVRAMNDYRGKKLNKAGPSTPVEVMGFAGIPNAGDSFQSFGTDKESREVALQRQLLKREEDMKSIHHVTLDELYGQIQSGKLKELNLIVKGDVHGSVEALVQSLEGLSGNGVNLKVLHTGTGEINESDVMLASVSNAIIIGFHVGQGEKVKRLGKEENVDIRTYHVIYDVISDIKKALEGLLEPEIIEVRAGRAEIRQVFDTSKGKIAGSYVIEGKIVRDSPAKIIRENDEIYRSKISSIRRFKENVNEVETGFECGISVTGFEDFQEGDIVETFKMEEK